MRFSTAVIIAFIAATSNFSAVIATPATSEAGLEARNTPEPVVARQDAEQLVARTPGKASTRPGIRINRPRDYDELVARTPGKASSRPGIRINRPRNYDELVARSPAKPTFGPSGHFSSGGGRRRPRSYDDELVARDVFEELIARSPERDPRIVAGYQHVKPRPRSYDDELVARDDFEELIARSPERDPRIVAGYQHVKPRPRSFDDELVARSPERDPRIVGGYRHVKPRPRDFDESA